MELAAIHVCDPTQGPCSLSEQTLSPIPQNSIWGTFWNVQEVKWYFSAQEGKKDFLSNRSLISYLGNESDWGKLSVLGLLSVEAILGCIKYPIYPPSLPLYLPLCLPTHPSELCSQAGCLNRTCNVWGLLGINIPTLLSYKFSDSVFCTTNFILILFCSVLIIQPSTDSLIPTLDGLDRLSRSPAGVKFQGHCHWNPEFH